MVGWIAKIAAIPANAGDGIFNNVAKYRASVMAIPVFIMRAPSFMGCVWTFPSLLIVVGYFTRIAGKRTIFAKSLLIKQLMTIQRLNKLFKLLFPVLVKKITPDRQVLFGSRDYSVDTDGSACSLTGTS